MPGFFREVRKERNRADDLGVLFCAYLQLPVAQNLNKNADQLSTISVNLERFALTGSHEEASFAYALLNAHSGPLKRFCMATDRPTRRSNPEARRTTLDYFLELLLRGTALRWTNNPLVCLIIGG